MAAAARKLDTDLMTVDEFLVWTDQRPDVLYDLVDGVSRAHDAPMTDHGVIQTNVTLLIGNHLRATLPRCRHITNPGVRPHIAANWNFRIPAMAVTCSDDRRNRRDIDQALLVVEVLSPGNVAATLSNIPLYASLPSVQEVLIIDSRKLAIQILRRGADGHWPRDPEAADPAAGCALTSIGLTLASTDVYRDTEVAEESGKH